MEFTGFLKGIFKDAVNIKCVKLFSDIKINLSKITLLKIVVGGNHSIDKKKLSIDVSLLSEEERKQLMSYLPEQNKKGITIL